MDGQQFDNVAKALAGGVSRRGILFAGAGGVAAALGLRLRGARGAQVVKKPLCHATQDPANPWVVIEVAKPSWDTHFAHGDSVYVNCCADPDCGAGETCVDGACASGCSPACQTDPITGQICVGKRCVPACGGEPCAGANDTCCIGNNAEGVATHGVCCQLGGCCQQFNPDGSITVTGCKDASGQCS